MPHRLAAPGRPWRCSMPRRPRSALSTSRQPGGARS